MKIICLYLLQILFLCSGALAQSEETDKSQEFYQNLSCEDYEKLLATETTYLLYDDLGAIKFFAVPHWRAKNAFEVHFNARLMPNFYEMTQNGYLAITGVYTHDDINIADQKSLEKKIFSARSTHGLYKPYFYSGANVVNIGEDYSLNDIQKVIGKIVLFLPINISSVSMPTSEVGQEYNVGSHSVKLISAAEEYVTISHSASNNEEFFIKAFDKNDKELSIRRTKSSILDGKTITKVILSASPKKIIFAVPEKIINKTIDFELK